MSWKIPYPAQAPHTEFKSFRIPLSPIISQNLIIVTGLHFCMCLVTSKYRHSSHLPLALTFLVMLSCHEVLGASHVILIHYQTALLYTSSLFDSAQSQTACTRGSSLSNSLRVYSGREAKETKGLTGSLHHLVSGIFCSARKDIYLVSVPSLKRDTSVVKLGLYPYDSIYS